MVDDYSDLIGDHAPAKRLPKRAIETLADLPAKQQAFVVAYLADPEMNVTRAAIQAGYAESAAATNGRRVLERPEVQRVIRDEMRKRALRTQTDRDAVIHELAAVAFGDIRALYREDGSLKSPAELDDAAAKALASIEVETDRHGTTTSKVKRWDKMRALELLGKHLGMFRDRVELTGADGGPVQVEIVQFGETIEGEAEVIEE